jgi:16S rRNA (cytosine1402-N4)-methyltransferase
MGEPTPVHIPVMLDEVLEHLAPAPGELIVDATVGLGGHAEAILRALDGRGTLLAIDRDPSALQAAGERLLPFGPVVRYYAGEFSRYADFLRDFLRNAGIAPEGAVHGFFLDLGVSSMQLDRAERGFSFQKDGPLDMRMDTSAGETAAEWIARVSPRELEMALRRFGEEPSARRIAAAIDAARGRGPIERTAELASIILSAIPEPRRGTRKIHGATRSFQAIRIAVNRELEILHETLGNLDRFLAPGGRLVVLGYHSLEDGIVKRTIGGRVAQGLYRWAFRGVGRPSAHEVNENPRSRSARLRVAIRT